MSAIKPLGNLVIQLPQDNNQYACFLQSGIPLLEGGILYHGLFSSIENTDTTTLQLHISKNVLDVTHYSQREITSNTPEGAIEYDVVIGVPSDTTVKTEELILAVHASAEDTLLFHGTAAVAIAPGAPVLDKYKFIYKDIHEPLTMGVIALVAVGVWGINCFYAQYNARIRPRTPKKIKTNVDYGLGIRGLKLGLQCTVEEEGGEPQAS